MTRVLIIASKDDPNDGWTRAKQLVDGLRQANLEVTLLNKLSHKYEDLLQVVRNRVVATPTILAFNGDKLKLRKVGLTTARALIEALKT